MLRFVIIAGTIACYAAYVHVWRLDRPEIVAPPNSAIATAVNADLYALLARGFSQGHLYLAAEPPAALSKTPNPYDPSQRPPVLYLHDASYYLGHYYIYFGPAPALLLYAPWQLLSGHDLPTPWAVCFFACAAYLAIACLFGRIRKEYFIQASWPVELAAYLALGSVSLWVPLVRRPGVYEAAIACGCAAAMWGLYCAWRSRTATAAITWGAACGALMGVAAAARPTLGLAAVPALVLMWDGRRTNWRTAAVDRRVWAATATGAIFIGLLLIYNYARFGHIFEFGQTYQLSSANEGAIQHFGAQFAPAQLWFYLLAPLRFSGHFPFFRDVGTIPLPPNFGTHEYSFGLLTNLPIVWLLPLGIVWGWRNRATSRIVPAIGLGALVAMLPLVFFFGSCIRYQAEFAPYFALLAAIGIMAADKWAASRVMFHAPVKAIALALAGITWLVVFFASIDIYDGAADSPPPAFDTIGRWLNVPIAAWDAAHGIANGPIELTFEPGEVGHHDLLILAEGPSGDSESLCFQRLDTHRGQLSVHREGQHQFEIAAEVDIGTAKTHIIHASLGSLYPVRAIEMATSVSRRNFRAFKLWVRVDWDGKRVIDTPMPAASWRTQKLLIAPQSVDIQRRGGQSGRVIATRRTEIEQAPAQRTFKGVTLSVPLDTALTGHSFPLAVTGYEGRGDFLFARIEADGRIRFGYDHWGKPGLQSTAVTFTTGTHQFEFWMPSLEFSDRAEPLIVELDGDTIWCVSVPFYPAGPDEKFIARNPLGGSSCENEFPGAQIKATDRPRR